MVSLIIFSTGVLGLSSFQSFVLQSTALAKQRTEALLVATNVIETIKSHSISNLEKQANGKQKQMGSNTEFTTRWDKELKENGDIILNTIISWPDRNHLDDENKPVASPDTTLTFKSTLSRYPYSDDSLTFKQVNKHYISVSQALSARNENGNLKIE